MKPRMTDVVLPPTFEQTAGTGSAVWHASLPIQINWTYEIDYCTARIFCPGNVHRWEMAVIHGPDPEQTKAYARLITAAPELLAALTECHRRLKMDLDEILHLRGWLSSSELAERKVQDEVADEADRQAIDQAAAAIAKAKGGAQ